MSNKQDGGTAYPQNICENCHDPIGGSFTGMTLRDYFAGQALAGFTYVEKEPVENYCIDAYSIADAMLKEREK